MILIPTLEVLGQQCVTLAGGRLDAAMVWHVDPMATVQSWVAAGASWIQITDFDSVDSRDVNNELVLRMIRSLGCSVQLAGGFRSADRVVRAIEAGAGRVVVSTLAVREPDVVKTLARRFPDQIVLSVDVANGCVMTEGWRRKSAYAPDAFISAFNETPLASVIVTDIDNDIADKDAQLGVIAGLAASARAPVIASGVVRNLDDVSRLKYVPNISGALIGRALFRKSIDLADAFRVAQPEPEPIAAFQ